jgi:hypothetical protein
MDNDERFNLTDQAVQDEPPVSPLDQLAAKHRELADTREVDIPVPGYDKQPPLLYIRYRLLEGNSEPVAAAGLCCDRYVHRRMQGLLLRPG